MITPIFIHIQMIKDLPESSHLNHCVVLKLPVLSEIILILPAFLFSVDIFLILLCSSSTLIV